VAKKNISRLFSAISETEITMNDSNDGAAGDKREALQ
jgi:hypothetical protein